MLWRNKPARRLLAIVALAPVLGYLKRIARTGLYATAHGQGRLAAAQLAPGLPYAETRRLPARTRW
ncbi:hypothetical protein H9639_15860 [Arthrobacter sp. Sa2CUA1]|uniref:Uncharacterized protein n=1 Tax=Arthrobacter gallicola TaxID=2762225 RepID=A0ABR8UW50_9MICC|nr:hypothetical protein [Arthrobacter gallicola]MBD7996773.1 hypothetical protein [Arthrobacter gallicola]